MSLYDVLTAAADGRPPEPDGSVGCCPQDGPAAGVVAFSAHFVVCADVDPRWVATTLPPGDYSAPHGARFLVALADRIGVGHRRAGRRAGAGRRPGGDRRARPRGDRARATTRGWCEHCATATTCGCGGRPDSGGHVLIGRGLAGRWEMAFEVEPAARGLGLGRRLAAAAAALVPAGEPIWAQVSPGHPASLRAVLAAGYRPVCAEVLLPPRP